MIDAIIKELAEKGKLHLLNGGNVDEAQNTLNNIINKLNSKAENKEAEAKEKSIEDIIHLGMCMELLEQIFGENKVKKNTSGDSIVFKRNPNENKGQSIFAMLDEEAKAENEQRTNSDVKLLISKKHSLEQVIGKQLVDDTQIFFKENIRIKFISTGENIDSKNIRYIQIYKGFGIVLYNNVCRYYTRVNFIDGVEGLGLFDNLDDFIYGQGGFKGLKDVLKKDFYNK